MGLIDADDHASVFNQCIGVEGSEFGPRTRGRSSVSISNGDYSSRIKATVKKHSADSHRSSGGKFPV